MIMKLSVKKKDATRTAENLTALFQKEQHYQAQKYQMYVDERCNSGQYFQAAGFRTLKDGVDLGLIAAIKVVRKWAGLRGH